MITSQYICSLIVLICSEVTTIRRYRNSIIIITTTSTINIPVQKITILNYIFLLQRHIVITSKTLDRICKKCLYHCTHTKYDWCCCALAYTPREPQRDFFVGVMDLAGSRDSWFRDTSVDPKRCSRVVASAGHSMSQCSKVCWPSRADWCCPSDLVKVGSV